MRRFAKGWSQNRGAVTAEAYVPLYYAPGEAYQFDWSHEVVVISGVTVTVKVAHVPRFLTGSDPPISDRQLPFRPPTVTQAVYTARRRAVARDGFLECPSPP